MALSPAFLEELRARTPMATLVGRRVRLARSGRHWKGCCPFHNEKTPSFAVYDDGYHCFGCGAHGDAISFVMQTQGASFSEALEQLAAEAGLDVPRPSPEAAEADRRRLSLQAVLAAACLAYQRRLRLPEGRVARDYLHGRGLSDETIERFGLGWSPNTRGSLTSELAREGVTAAQLAEAGLLREDRDAGRCYDLFYQRVMFPIHDRRGRTISFGGRTLGEGQPKYVNGPETPLFSKRRSLYGLDLAREAVNGGAPLLVVEGYMDVIALAQAGFAGAVAPLGTALTEEQLGELWRLSPAPVLCFDGDAAGARAAARAAETALPMLSPERTLSFISLPPGEDPDSLTRRSGAEGFAAALAKARSMSEALYDLLKQGRLTGTPEQRAAFSVRLEAAARRIPDKALSWEYRKVLRERFRQEGLPARARFGSRTLISGFRGSGQRARDQWPAPARYPRPAPGGKTVTAERNRILTAILLRHPALLREVEHAFADLTMPAAAGTLRDAICRWSERTEILDSTTLIDHLTKSGFQTAIENTLATVPVPLPACASGSAMPAEALAGWWHIYGFLNVDRLRQEVAQARESLARNMVSENEVRLTALMQALEKVQAGEPDGADTVAV